MKGEGLVAVVDLGQVAVVGPAGERDGSEPFRAMGEPSASLDFLVRAKRRASSLSSFSETASSMIAARSPSGTRDRMRARSRSSLSWSWAEAVHWTL